MSMLDFNITKETISELFPEESYTKAIEIIKKIKGLIPENEYNLIYFEKLIAYVDAIINGDDIHQYMTREAHSKFAEEALQKIIDEILESHRLEKIRLQSEVSTLRPEKETLDREIQDLQSTRTNLIRETSSLSIELDKLTSQLQELRITGINQVHEEIDEERNKLSMEVDALTKAKEELSKAINEYNLTIASLSEKKQEENSKSVVWEPLSEDDPILEILYNATNENIYDFINSLKSEYMNNTGVNESNCDEEFNKHTPSLDLIPQLMKKLIWDELASLIYILNHKYDSADDKYNVIRLQRAIKDLKKPVYLKNESKKEETKTFINESTQPTDISSIKRELYLQKMTMESMAKAAILEAQFKSLLETLNATLPEEYVRNIVSTYGELFTTLKTGNQNSNRFPKLQL